MSAQEIIEEPKTMPPEARKEVATFVRNWNAADRVQPEPEWDAIIEKVFDEHDKLFRKLAR